LNPRYAIFLSLFLICQSSFAQIEVVPIYREPLAEKGNKNARVGSIPAKSLPFWDDFSERISMGFYPNDQVWENSRSVWVNSGMGINPPTLNVATFDGYDSLGKPYKPTSIDILEKGNADKMTSGPLKLGDVDVTQRASVFISFFYQFKGNGEAPDPGDLLTLLFKNNLGQWKSVWSIENNGTLASDRFVEVILPIGNSEYFHNDFQFRFQNFARLSGPYDTWNIDYVYVSNGKAQYSPVYQDFPDRAISLPLSSIFYQYQSIPVKHFLTAPNENLKAPSVRLTNQRKDQATGGQPSNYSASVNTVTKKNGVVTTSKVVLANEDKIGFGILYDRSNFFTLKDSFKDLLKLNLLDPLIESLSLEFIFNISADDNQIKTKNIATGADVGDYDSIAYKGINFRKNDTTKTNFILKDYYAYDDGIAEFGAKLSGVGTQLAYQYDLKATNTNDGLIAIDLYFPRFGDESSQTIQLHVMGALTGNDSDYLFRQNVTVQRNNQNKFWRFEIPGGVSVPTPFYIGWKLNSPAVIAIGLDRNTDSGSKMFFNATGAWEQNTTLQGSLMLRPVFGTAIIPITEVDNIEPIKPYPNPTNGVFFLPKNTSSIAIYDLNGRVIRHETEDNFENIKVTISNPSAGLYVVQYLSEKWMTEKVIVNE
jgi:hypothetical protein